MRRIKSAENSLNMVQKTFLSSLLLSIFQQSRTKLLHLVQEGYISSSACGAQKRVTTIVVAYFTKRVEAKALSKITTKKCFYFFGRISYVALGSLEP
jgi:hypothetical protein